MNSNCRICGVDGKLGGPIIKNPEDNFTFRCNRCSLGLWKMLVWDTYGSVGTPMLAGSLASSLILQMVGISMSRTSLVLGGLGFYSVLIFAPLFWAWKLKMFR